MGVTLIDETSRSAFSRYMPDFILEELPEPETVAFGAVDDKTNVAAGVAVGQVIGEQLEIIWLYIDEAYRERGLAHELLDAVAVASFGKVSGVISGFDAGNRAVLNLFRRHGFTVVQENSPVYSLTVQAIGENKFFKKTAVVRGAVPVGEVPKYALSVFERHLSGTDSGVPVETPINLEKFDSELSMAYIGGREVRGILLFSPISGGYDLSLAYVMPGEKTALAAMLRSAAKILIEKYPPETRVSIAALGGSAAIVEKLFPKTVRLKRFMASYIFVGMGAVENEHNA